MPSLVKQLGDRTYSISVLETAHTHEACTVVLTLDQLKAAMRPTKSSGRTKKDGGAWSPITWRECTDEECADEDRPEHTKRVETHALAVCALVYDCDNAPEDRMGALGARLIELEWVWLLHETYTRGRYRLIIPLGSDVSPEDYAGLWWGVLDTLGLEPYDKETGTGEVDAGCVDLARLSYLPAHPPGEEREAGDGGRVLLDPSTVQASTSRNRPTERASGGQNGPKVEATQGRSDPASTAKSISAADQFPKILDLDQLRGCVANLPPDTRKPLLEALSWKLRLPKGNRENPLHQLTSALTTVLPQEGMGDAWEVVKTIFGHVVDTMVDPTLSPDEYMAKVRHSFERAWEHRENKSAKREAALKFFQPEEGTDEEWRNDLITIKDKDGEPMGYKGCTYNLDAILEHDPNFRTFIQFNDLRRRVEITGGPLKAPKGSGTAALALSNWLQASEYQLHVDRMTCGAAILHAAKRHHFNPVEDYLLGLHWDGKERCKRVLLDYCEARGNEDYIADITRKFFLSAVARALQPGCKVDTVLVLQGIQGTRKTSFVETLAGEWYTTVGNKFTDKDTQMQSTAAWFVEMSELASLSRGTNSHLRGYLTKRFDPIRVPYAETHEDYDRRCVFVGTTNDDQPLIDPDGNRRYWVVACGEINIRALSALRDQIWAEAVHMFRKYQEEMARGVAEQKMEFRWWFTRPEQDVADLENSVFEAENPIEDDINHWLSSPKKKPEFVTCSQLAKLALHMTAERLASDDTILPRISKTLINMGWKKVRRGSTKVGGGGRYWAFELPIDAE